MHFEVIFLLFSSFHVFSCIVIFLFCCLVLGASNTPVVSTTTDVKLTDTSTQKVNRAVPRVPSNVSTASPTSNASTASSDSKSPTRPAKGMANLSCTVEAVEVV